MSTLVKHYRPIAKLQQLIDLKRAHFPIGKGIRAGLAIGLTFGLGVLTGYALEGVFSCIAALSFSAGEANNMTYRAMLRHTLIASTIGGLGVLAGVLIGLPWFAIIIIMTLLGFVCMIVSNYGMPYSVGTMIALIIATVVVGMPVEGMGWKLFFCFQLGTALYLFLLGCQALFDSHYPERQLLSGHIRTQANYARVKAKALSEVASGASADTQSARVNVEKSLDAALDSYFSLYSAVLNGKYHNSSERALETDRQGARLQALDSVLSHMRTVNHDPDVLVHAADWLDAVAQAKDNKSKIAPQLPDSLDKESDLFYSLARLSELLWPSAPIPASVSKKTDVKSRITLKERAHNVFRRLIVGKEATVVALIFAVCLAIALSTKYFITANHWYWVPLTVAIVMKPDFGSVFARAIARSVGTILGACLGTLLLLLLPKGPVLIAVIALLATLLPWTKLISYAAQATAITAIMLVLLDLASKGTVTVNYAGQRVGDTVLASAIVLFFSYLVWPRSKHIELSKKFSDILEATQNYLKTACQADNNDKNELERISKEVFKRKITAYRAISDFRSMLHRLAVEPAPTGPEAISWLPLVGGAERLCNKIDTFFVRRTTGSAIPDPADVSYVVHRLDTAGDKHGTEKQHVFAAAETESDKQFLFDINEEVSSLLKMMQKSAPVAR